MYMLIVTGADCTFVEPLIYRFQCAIRTSGGIAAFTRLINIATIVNVGTERHDFAYSGEPTAAYRVPPEPGSLDLYWRQP